ncbi:MAG: glycosyltransferase family 39 protein [Ardenticatenaceae bacterium]|nr:glycosyltransferase family 39 protein [Ardenticatenaceae bacterium]
MSVRRRRTRAWESVTLLAVLMLADGLRLFRLEDASIWWDEGLAVWAARQSPLAIARWTATDVHPPLYFWLLHFWRALAGDGEFAVRWLSVAFGTLTVALLWRLGRTVAGRRVALLAALLLALSRFAVWWSQETRMYILGALLATLSLYLTVRLHRRPSWPLALAYLAVTVAALWTLYLLAFLLVIEGLYWLATLPQGRVAWRGLLLWAGLQATVLLSFAPWLAYALPRMHSWSVQVPFDPELYARLYATLLAVGTSVDIDRYWPATAAVLLLLPVGLALATERDWELTRRDSPRWPRRTFLPVSNHRAFISNPQSLSVLLLLALTLLLPPLVVWGVTTMPRAFGYSPKPEARYLLPYAPAFSLLLAWAIAGLAGTEGWGRRRARWRAWAAGLATLALLGLAGWSLRDYFAGRYREDDYVSVAATMRAFWHAGDGVLLHTDQPWPVFAYHWSGEFQGITYTQFVDEAAAAARIEPLWKRHSGLWLVLNEDAQRVDPGHIVEHFLAQRALAQRDWRFGPKRLLFFARTPERAASIGQLASGWRPPGPAEPLLAPGLRVEGWEQPLRRYQPGESAHLFTTVDAAPGSPLLSLTLGRVDAPIARATSVPDPAGGRQRLQFDLIIPPDAPASAQPWTLRVGPQRARVGQAILLGGHSTALSPPPAIATPLEATFGEPPPLKLLGYDLPTSAAPGDTVHLTLYWQALRPIPLPYKVFTHIINADEHIWGQKDDVPAAGARPTTGWLPGEIIVDPYAIPLNPEAPAGRYRLEIGLYDAATGQRLGPARDAAGQQLNGERVLLGEIEVQ